MFKEWLTLVCSAVPFYGLIGVFPSSPVECCQLQQDPGGGILRGGGGRGRGGGGGGEEEGEGRRRGRGGGGGEEEGEGRREGDVSGGECGCAPCCVLVFVSTCLLPHLPHSAHHVLPLPRLFRTTPSATPTVSLTAKTLPSIKCRMLTSAGAKWMASGGGKGRGEGGGERGEGKYINKMTIGWR